MESDVAMPYFGGRWADRLPHKAVAKHCQARLDELILPIREAIAEPEAAYEVPQATLQSIELIGFEVAEAKREYSRHRKVLQVLEETVQPVSEEADEDPKAGRGIRSLRDRETLLKEFGDRRGGKASGSDPSEAERGSPGGPLPKSIGGSDGDTSDADERPGR